MQQNASLYLYRVDMYLVVRRSWTDVERAKFTLDNHGTDTDCTPQTKAQPYALAHCRYSVTESTILSTT